MKKLIITITFLLLISCWTVNTEEKNEEDIIQNSNNEVWVIPEKENIVTEDIEENNSWAIIIEENNNEENNSWVVIIEKMKDKENILKKEENNNIVNKYCILTHCIPTDVEVTEKGWFYIWEKKEIVWKNKEVKEYKYKLNKDYSYIEIELEEMMHRRITKVTKIWDVFIETIDDSWCWGSNIDQKVYNKEWAEIKYFLFSEYNKSINIGNIIFNPTLVWKWWFWQPLDSFNAYKIYKSESNKGYKVFNNDEEFKKYVEDKVLNVDKKLYGSYITKYKEYPGVYFMYNSASYDGKSLRTVYLWTDKNYLNKNIKDNWDYLDLAITNKIIWYYNKNTINFWLFDSEWNRIKSVAKENLPVFSMKKLNDEWNYLVYLKPWYEWRTLAEMCKPVVYYYSDEKEKNTLTLNLKKWDYFTNLIPNLNKDSSWNFSSDNSMIIVDNKEYDYLYYSLVTTWYEHNKDWWIVSWNNVVKFFNDKLDKINFNKKEKKDFIDFWKEEYEKDKYYFISFKYKDELDKIIKLDFTKKIDNEFRVLLDSYELDSYSEEDNKNYLYEYVKDDFDKYLIKRFDRGNNDREVFEWGWVLRKKDETIIK